MNSKYHAKKTPCLQGHIHDSKFEADRCNILHIRQKHGLIQNLEVQKSFLILESKKYPDMPNERSVVYNADFVYIENGRTIIEDTKGMKTPDYVIKRKFVKSLYCTDGKTIFREVQRVKSRRKPNGKGTNRKF